MVPTLETQRPEDLVRHDRVVPGDGIEDGRVKVARFRIRRAPRDDLFLIDEAQSLKMQGLPAAMTLTAGSERNVNQQKFHS
jgi:hypothetical protein